MVKIVILKTLVLEIKKKFNKSEANKILNLMQSLENNPNKGKLLGSVGGIIIKELKYKNFRFYFLADGYKLKYLDKKEFVDLLLKFVRMSDKKHQQKAINEIKTILLKIGFEDF